MKSSDQPESCSGWQLPATSRARQMSVSGRWAGRSTSACHRTQAQGRAVSAPASGAPLIAAEQHRQRSNKAAQFMRARKKGGQPGCLSGALQLRRLPRQSCWLAGQDGRTIIHRHLHSFHHVLAAVGPAMHHRAASLGGDGVAIGRPRKG